MQAHRKWYRVSVVLGLVMCAACSAQKADRPAQQKMSETLEPTRPPETQAEKATATTESRRGVLIGISTQNPPMPKLNTSPRAGQTLLVTINTPYQMFNGRSTLLHVSAWRADGRPAVHADVFVGGHPVGKTGALGVLAFRYPVALSKKHLPVNQNIISVIDSRDQNIQGHLPFRIHKRTTSFQRDVLYVQTDRGVYEPGEALNVRSIGWHLTDGFTPLVHKQVRVSLRHASTGVIAQGEVLTDEFGVGAVSIRLPKTLAEGVYELIVQYNGERQSSPIQVRRNIRPTATLTHQLPTWFVGSKTRLSGDVTVRSLRGREVKNGHVDVTARTLGGQTLFTLRQAVQQGQVSLAISSSRREQLLAALQRDGAARWSITWRGPQAGQRAHVVHTMHYARAPYLGTLEVDRSFASPGEAVSVIATVKQLNGRALAQSEVSLTVKAAGDVAQRIKATTDARGVAQWKVPMGKKSVQLQMHHPKFKVALAERTLAVRRPQSMSAQFDRTSATQNQYFEVTVRLPKDVVPAESVVHMDMVDSTGAIVHSQLLPITRRDARLLAQARVPAVSWGTALMTFYVLARKRTDYVDPKQPHHSLGVLTEGRAMVVSPNQKLRVELDGVPDVVKPGQVLNVRAQIRDVQGRAVQAAVGISMVDAVVMSLLKTWRSPEGHFYSPSHRSVRTSSSRLLTWPVLSRNWGSQTYDLALPPFPFYGGGSLRKPVFKPSVKVLAGMTPERQNPSVVAKKRKQDDKLDEDEGYNRKLNKPQSTAIAIRTTFKHNHLWQPHRRAQGSLRMQIKAPDQIGPQQLTIVASDRRGGVGSAQATIDVTQPLYASVGWPERLLVNEQVLVPITVHNQLPQPQKTTLTINAPDLGVVNQRHQVTVGGYQRGVIWQKVHPKQSGEASYQIELKGASAQDVLARQVMVYPQGLRVDEVVRQKKSKSRQRFVLSTQAIDDTTGLMLHLHHPQTLPMDQFLALDKTIRRDPFGYASDLASAAAILRYARVRGQSSKSINRLRRKVRRAAAALSFGQRRDGSFTYWRNDKPSAFVTAWALDGLLETQDLDVPVPQKSIIKAAHWLVEQFDRQLRLKQDGVLYWEGKQAGRLIAAQVYHVLSRVPRIQRTPRVKALLKKLDARYLKQLKTQKTTEPALLAYALLGALNTGALSASSPEASAALKQLLLLMDQANWQPSWFSAYGGQVALRWSAIALILKMQPRGIGQTRLADLTEQILASRASWGQWHNERETAAAIRALAAVANHHKVKATRAIPVRVVVQGKTIKRATLKANSAPLVLPVSLKNASARSLIVDVIHDGPRPHAQLVKRTWLLGQKPLVKTTTAQLHVIAPDKVTTGQRVQMKVQLQRKTSSSVDVIEIAHHPGLSLDERSLLRQFKQHPHWLRYHRAARGWRFELAPGANAASLELTYDVLTGGKQAWPTVKFKDAVASAGQWQSTPASAQ